MKAGLDTFRWEEGASDREEAGEDGRRAGTATYQSHNQRLPITNHGSSSRRSVVRRATTSRPAHPCPHAHLPRSGKTWVLIATDLIGRGMDFVGVNTVVNYDFPRTTADYVHRIGRTGRAGRTGEWRCRIIACGQ